MTDAADARPTRPAVSDGVVVAGALVGVLVTSFATGQAPVANAGTAVIAAIVLVGFAVSAFVGLRGRLPTDVRPLRAPVAYGRSLFDGLVVLVVIAAVTVLVALIEPVGVVLSLAVVGLVAGRLVRVVSWERRHGVTLVDDPDDDAAYVALRP